METNEWWWIFHTGCGGWTREIGDHDRRESEEETTTSTASETAKHTKRQDEQQWKTQKERLDKRTNKENVVNSEVHMEYISLPVFTTEF